MKNSFKKIQLVLVFVFGIIFIGCSESKSTSLTSNFDENNLVEAVVVKDCSGSYLRINNKDYLVCNYKVLGNYSSEQKIMVNYKPIKECNWDENSVICEMYHENAGLIEITGIKK